MLPESTTSEGEKQKQMDRQVRDMVSALTHRLGDLQQVHKPGSSHPEDEDEHGVRIITLSGSNTGATMRSELDEKSKPHGDGVEQEALSTFVNSNFQAINNSIMLGGSYTCNDPGVHLDVSELFEQLGPKPDKQGKKEKKKDKETSESD